MGFIPSISRVGDGTQGLRRQLIRIERFAPPVTRAELAGVEMELEAAPSSGVERRDKETGRRAGSISSWRVSSPAASDDMLSFRLSSIPAEQFH